MPFEGNLATRHLTGYDPVPDRMLPNDDLDLQVVNLEIIRRFGLPVNRRHLSTMWEYTQDGGPDEYGPARWNVSLRRYAPLSGYYCNKFYAGMGAAIRSELWACLAPGDPALAVRLAMEDACSDHYADGMEACMFLAAIESAAFVESDRDRLIEIGLSYIEPDGRLARGIRDSIGYYEQTRDPYAARELLLEHYYVQNWTDVTINLCLIVISWLASEGDFSKAICTAAGLGYDTDCTCATLASILGIINPDAISLEWTAPIGDTLVLSCGIMGTHEPETIGGFCDLVADTAVQVCEYYDAAVKLENAPALSVIPHWTEDCHAADGFDCTHESMVACTPLTLRLIYPETVSLIPGRPDTYTLVLRNPAGTTLSGEVKLSLPDGWQVEPASATFTLEPSAEMRVKLTITAAMMEKRRPRDNNLDLDFTVNGISWRVSAGLPTAIPWLRENLLTGEVEQIEAHEVFQTVPAGRWCYRTAMKVNEFMQVRMGVMSQRPFTAKFNGKEVSSGDGSFYVPAFHRGRTAVNLSTDRLDGRWNYVEIIVEDGEPGELFFGLARQHSCGEWLIGVEYSLAPLLQ